MASTGAAYRSTIINVMFGNYDSVSITAPSQLYIGYCVGTITAGSATECADSGYTAGTGATTAYPRQPIHFTTSSAGSTRTSDGTTSANGTAVVFGQAASGHSVYGVAIFDAAEAGNQLTDWVAVNNSPVAVATGQSYRLASGAVTLADKVWATS